MKHFKEVTETKTKLDKITCDWCDREILENENEDYFYMELNYRHFYSFHEDAFTYDDSWSVDLCPYCINKVRKFLEDNGVKVQENG